jgi:hypothetical protein
MSLRPRPPRNEAGPHRPDLTGPIEASTLYPVRTGASLAGWGAKSLASAKKQGLRVLSFAGRSYLYGDDIIHFLLTQPARKRPVGGGRPDLLARRKATAPDSASPSGDGGLAR